MADYDFTSIENKWQLYWEKEKTYHVSNDSEKPKYYVLDMFPYPSGSGLHVGHPLGYIASDIYSRYKTLKGYNVLHPMGFDAFGLPAEQYAIQTGQHPAITTEDNIRRYKSQLMKMGLAYDWSREVRTCDPRYYKWTQWTFIQLFKHWYNPQSNKAEPIEKLEKIFSTSGNAGLVVSGNQKKLFSAKEWNEFTEVKKQEILMNYRLAYQATTTVNWCPELGTVLANDEVRDGFSIRGNHPVVQKEMKQWLLRVSAYSERLLSGLDEVDWSDSLKEMQRNWIGRSTGASIEFNLHNSELRITVFTTRPDTLFGSTFMVLAPEHPAVMKITTSDYKEAIEHYIERTKKRSERDRLAEVKKISGQFTGAHAVHPFTGELLPVWIADYVLMHYGTGSIMAVPAHDNRDYAFARHFNLPVKEVVKGGNIDVESYDAKEGILVNSDFLNGLQVKEAIDVMIKKLEEKGIGEGRVNYRMRDAIFSRQRYWGEPFPVYYIGETPYVMDENSLPLELPQVEDFRPSKDAEAPLAKVKNWKTKEGHPIETHTMPGFAGSSGYYLRYMDPQNDKAYFSKEAVSYWQDVDLYIGGTEHATGHLIYARFWNKFLFDLGLSVKEEPFKKLVNQGMIQGRSSFVYRVNHEKYAEYLLWEKIKDGKTGCHFQKKYKEGHREFDFFCPKSKLVIEIKIQKKLEKLSSRYEDYFKKSDYKLIMIPAMQVIRNIDHVLEVIRKGAMNDFSENFLSHEALDIPPIFVSADYPDKDLFSTPVHADISLVDNDVLNIEAFRQWRPENHNAEFLFHSNKFLCGSAIEKMSKSMHNVVNPDQMIEKYGADTFRLYEMFLGPIEQSKPWNTDGIEGVHKFLKKFLNLFYNEQGLFCVSSDKATDEELKILHKSIRRIESDIERLCFNTCVSSFMIATNELTRLNCHKKEILEPLVVLLAPFAPHLCEELWHLLGHQGTVTKENFPVCDEKYLIEASFEYPVSINGKLRFKKNYPLDMPVADIEKDIAQDAALARWTEGKSIRKVIVVQGRIINIVV